MSPISLTIEDAVAFSGIARTNLYRLIGSGQVAAKKNGKRTLVMTESLTAYVNGLKAAEFGSGDRRTP